MEEKIKYTYKICPSCDFFCNELEPDEFCSICGSKLISGCPSCNNKILNPYASYCKFCGEAYPGREKDNKNVF